MNKLFFVLLLMSQSLDGQESFIKYLRTGAYVDNFTPPIELSNGNYICSVLLANVVWYNMLYLFDECGNLIISRELNVSAKKSTLITNLIELQSGDILATGNVYDSVSHSLHLILDKNTLETKKERLNFESIQYNIRHTEEKNGILYQTGGLYTISSTIMNLDLNRKLHLYKVYEEPEYPDLITASYLGYKQDRIYTIENYRDAESYIDYSLIRCQDQKMRDLYTIGNKVDTTYEYFDATVILFGGDSLLLGLSQRNKENNATRYLIRKYYRDSVIYERVDNDPIRFYEFNLCSLQNAKIICVDYKGAIGWFDQIGQLLYYTDQLTSILNEGDISGAIFTHDGGLFAASYDYIHFDNGWDHAIKLVKTTGDYQISPLPNPLCPVSTFNPIEEVEIQIYPNPSSGNIHIVSKIGILSYRIFNIQSMLVKTGEFTEIDKEIDLDLHPGYYLISFETKDGWVIKRLIMM